MKRIFLTAVTALSFFMFSGTAHAFSWENPSSTGAVSGSEAVSPEPVEKQQAPVVLKAPEAPTSEESAVESAPETPAPAAPVAIPAHSLRCSLFVNDEKNQNVLRGWPMIVKVVIENITKEGTAPVTLAGPAGKPAVSVHVRDEDKTIMRWGFQRAQGNPPNQPLQIAPGQAVTYVFLLSPKKSSKVESGTYRIFGSVAGIRGAVHPVTVTVEDHPESLSESQEASRQKLESLYRLFAGKK